MGMMNTTTATIPFDAQEPRQHSCGRRWISRIMDALPQNGESRLEVVAITPHGDGSNGNSPAAPQVIYRYLSPSHDTPTLSDSLKRRSRPSRKMMLLVTLVVGLVLSISLVVTFVTGAGSSTSAIAKSSDAQGNNKQDAAPSSQGIQTSDGPPSAGTAATATTPGGQGTRTSTNSNSTTTKKPADLETGVMAWTPPSRVRRSWKSYSDDDKKLYLRAVQLAMERGFHYRFVEVHTAKMNKITSHGACPFLLWHRRFILGYENMLRSLAPEFANLTLPYWNYFEDTNRQLASGAVCDSLEACSQFLRDMGGGGTTDLPVGQSLMVTGIDVKMGTCVSKGIAGHACDHVNGTASGQCSNCIMRGQWSNPRKIVETLGTDLLGVLNVFNATQQDEEKREGGAHGVLSHTIEATFHNAIHNTLNSSMRYTTSAFDPIFVGHHGMVDLAQFIVNRCKYVAGDASVKIDWSTEQRSTRFDVFTSCGIEDDDVVVHTAQGSEPMQMTTNDIAVEQDAFMKPFFSGFGNRYQDVANTEDLGQANSYTYAIDEYLQQLLAKHNVQCPDYLFTKPTPVRTAKASLRNLGAKHAVQDDQDHRAAMELMDVLASCGDEIQAKHPELNYQQRLEMEGLVKCLVVEQRSGGHLDDYDAEFRAMMHIPATQSPYCVSLLRRHRRGELPLLASNQCLRRYGDHTGVDLLSLVARH